MSIEEAICSRKSVRRFLTKPVPEQTVRHILELSIRAPSGNNIQPWRAYVVAGQVRDRLCAEMLDAAEHGTEQHLPEYEYYPTKWHEPYLGRRRKLGYDLYAVMGIGRDDKVARETQANRNFLFFDAPVGILVTVDRRLTTGSLLDVGMFLQNIMLAARGEGLHTCCQAAFSWYHDIVRKHLPLTENDMLVGGISLGYEDTAAPENKLITERAPVDEIAGFFGFGDA